MRKIVLYILVLSLFFSCRSVQSAKIETSTVKELSVSFNNNTDFAIDILENNPEAISAVLHIEPKRNKTFTKKIYAGDDISLFFYAKFYIPVGKTVVSVIDYRENRVETKNGLNQTVSITTLGAVIKNSPYYVVLKNKADKEISVCNSSAKSLYITLDKTKSVAPENIAVYSSKERAFYTQQDKISMRILYNDKEFDFPITFLQSGFVYTYIFDGKRIVKEDERPLLKIGEPLWKQSGADGVSVSNIMSAPARDSFYAVGKVRKKDANGSLYDAGFIQCTERNGTERWTHFFEETGCDSAVYDGIVLENSDLLAAGHTSGDVQNGLLLLYSSGGVLLNTQKITGSSGFESVTPLSGGTFLVTGFDSKDKLMFGKVHIAKSVIRYESFTAPLPLAGTEFVTSAHPLYDSRTKTLFICCNMLDTETELPLPSALFALAENGTAKRIPLLHAIKSVAAVSQDANGVLYIAGETGTAEHSTAMIVTVDAAQNKQAAFYTGGTPYAYIADMLLNEKSGELIIAGTEKAADSAGNGGTPFFKSLALASGKELWTAGYSDKTYELLSSFIPCTDYGFIAQFTSVNEDGEYSSPICTVRLSATGKTEK